jgi:hypothetical protein
MNAVERALRDFLNARPAEVAIALVGGLAVSARTEPRFTRDLDFAIAVVGDDDAAQYVFHLRQVGYEIAAALEQTTQPRLSTIRLRRGGRGRSSISRRAASKPRSCKRRNHWRSLPAWSPTSHKSGI